MQLSPHMLAKALAERRGPSEVPVGVVKVWAESFYVPEGAAPVSSQEELDAKYGDVLAAMVGEHSTGYRLQKALREHDPPGYVTLQAARAWLARYMNAGRAGHVGTREGEAAERGP